jgi:hypothetical protein
MDDSVLALWILELASAGEDCRNRLGKVQELINGK